MWWATIRTVLFYLLVVPFTLTWAAFFGLFAYMVPYPLRYYLVIGAWARGMHLCTQYILGIRVRVHGLEHVPPQACVIVANHQSAWETYFLQLLFHPQSQVAKASLLKIPLFGWTFAMMKPIAIDRTNKRHAMTQVIELGSQRIAEGNSVLIFPEGTRASPHQLLPFRQGGALLAKAAGCVMVPVSHNAGQYWRNDQFAKRAGTIDIHIHPALDSSTADAADLMAHAASIISNQLHGRVS